MMASLLLEEASDKKTTNNTLLILSFESLEDVQTRLVLLPRIEEEGVGAVVEQYINEAAAVAKTTAAVAPTTKTVVAAAATITSKDEKENKEDQENDDTEDTEEETSHSSHANSEEENADPAAATHDDTDENDDDHDSDTENNIDTTPLVELRGYVLNGIGNKKDDDEEEVSYQDLLEEDFASILAAIRSAPTPILLHFTRPESSSSEIVPAAIATVINSMVDVDLNTASNSAAAPLTTLTMTQQQSTSTAAEQSRRVQESHEASYSSSCGEEKKTGDEKDNTTDDDDNDGLPQAVVAAATHHDGVKNEAATPTTTPATATPAAQKTQSVQKFMSSWASRLSATAGQVAAETSAAAAAAVEAAAKETRKKMASPTPPPTPVACSSTEQEQHHDTAKRRRTAVAVPPPPPVVLGLYLQQASSGAFLPVAVSDNKSNSNKNGELRVITNSSLLLIRKSPTEPCPPPNCGYSYTWYRSSGDKQRKSKKALSSLTSPSSAFASSLSLVGAAHNNINNNSHSAITTLQGEGEAQKWTLLEGASRAAFQPTATEVGHRLRCVVRIRNSDVENDDGDENSEQVIILETRERVSAAMALFNGSRQALVRGAQFGGLTGCGNAEGRQFRIKVGMTSMRSTSSKAGGRSKKVATSAVTIYQVAGSTAEPMHPENEPLACVSAVVADHADPKALELTFPKGLPESASMVEALTSTSHGRFQLKCSNRLGRESLLLAIGIANFNGKPVDLDASMVLFDDDAAAVRRSSLGGDSISGSSSSTGGMSSVAGMMSYDGGESIGSAKSDSGVVVTDRCLLSSSPLASPSNSAPATPSRDQHHQHRLSIPRPQHPKRSNSLDFSSNNQVIVDLPSPVAAAMQASRIGDLEREVQFLRGKLTRKDKAFSELQRHVAQSEASRRQLEQEVSSSRDALQDAKSKLSAEEKRAESLADQLQGVQNQHALQVSSLETRVASQSDKIVELEKNVRTLQNEKAVLSASLEARDSKLTRMVALQTSFDELSEKVSESDALRVELEEANRRQKENTNRLQKLSLLEQERRAEVEQAKQQVAAMATQVEEERGRTASCRSELETQQMRIQKLKAERNSYKQKGDSLAKEIAKVCRNGRTIKDVEKIILDDASRKQEVTLLREQKRKALDEIQHYRTALEQCRAAQRLAGDHGDSTRVLERNAELFRLLTEQTEYISAKEEQVETLKLVIEELQAEIRTLSRAQMNKNDV